MPHQPPHRAWIPANRTVRAIALHLLHGDNAKAISLTWGEREISVRAVTRYGGLSIPIRVKLGKLWEQHGADLQKHREIQPELLERLSA